MDEHRSHAEQAPIRTDPPTGSVRTLADEYTSLDEVITALTALEQAFRADQDRRAVFTTAYLVITAAIKQRIDAGWFLDNAWVARYTVGFANLYRQALHAFERGDVDSVPKAWRFSFETSRARQALLIQDLLLGINAHINYDLALALHSTAIDPDRRRRYQDHTAVNQVLQAAVDALQARVCDLYAPVLTLVDNLGGQLDETLASFSVAKARESAWLGAVALTHARDDQAQAVLRHALNDRAAVLARLMLSPNPRYPWLIGALHHLEGLRPWWTALTPHHVEQQLAHVNQPAPPTRP